MGIDVINGRFSNTPSKDTLRSRNRAESSSGMFRQSVPKIVEHTLTTGGTSSTVTALIPDGAAVRGYRLTVLETIVVGTDRTTVNFGHAAAQVQYGTKALVALQLVAGTKVTFADGSSFTSVPLYTANQDFVISVTGGTTGNITAGKVRIEIWYDITE